MMPVEIEAKMRLDDEPAMIALLRQRGAVRVGDFLETNTFYDTKDRSLLANDSGLRLRIAKDLNTGQERYIITHKGPNHVGLLKMREETELEVASATDAEQLLNQLGFMRRLRFQKRRHSWTLDDCQIELDRLPILGNFIEIEGPSESAVMRTRANLGLSHCPLVKKGYATMVSRLLEDQGVTRELELVFADGTL